MVDLDRRQAQPLEAGNGAHLAHESRQGVAGRAVSVAAEVDPREDNLLVTVRDAPPNFIEHRGHGAATRSTTDKRNHAEVAGEAAAVLDLHERAHAVETGTCLNAPDRAHVSGHEGRCLLARPGNHGHVGWQAREGVAGEIRSAAGHVNATVRACRARGRLARLSDGLVRDAARVDDRDVGTTVHALFEMTVRQQALADFLRVRVRDLAAEKTDRERRHGSDANWPKSPALKAPRNGPQPNPRA